MLYAFFLTLLRQDLTYPVFHPGSHWLIGCDLSIRRNGTSATPQIARAPYPIARSDHANFLRRLVASARASPESVS